MCVRMSLSTCKSGATPVSHLGHDFCMCVQYTHIAVYLLQQIHTRGRRDEAKNRGCCVDMRGATDVVAAAVDAVVVIVVPLYSWPCHKH